VLIAPSLHQHFQDLALVIDGAPEVHPPTRDPHNHLIKMPSVTRARASSPQPLRHRRPELQDPAADCLIGNIEPTLGKEILNVAVAQGEAKIEPDRVLDNRRRKAVAAIGEQGHARMLSYPPFSRSPVSVTMPRLRIGIARAPVPGDAERLERAEEIGALLARHDDLLQGAAL